MNFCSYEFVFAVTCFFENICVIKALSLNFRRGINQPCLEKDYRFQILTTS